MTLPVWGGTSDTGVLPSWRVSSDSSALLPWGDPTGHNDFISTWDTTNPGSSNNDQITLGLHPSGTYNFVVNWGDGNEDTITSGTDPLRTHTYSVAGVKTVTIRGNGTFSRWFFNNSDDEEKITSIDVWGDNVYDSMNSAFFGCINLDIENATDLPKTSTVTSFEAAFRDLPTVNMPLFDMSSNTTLNSTFRNMPNLETIPLIITTNVTTWISTFSTDPSLTSVAFLDMANSTDFNKTFFDTGSLTDADLDGTPVTISYETNLLSQSALVDIFNGLATVVGQTITITGNPGTAGLTAPEIAIATDKGWTVVT